MSLVALRHALHACAETAMAERRTAATVTAFLEEHGVRVLADDIAGHGVLARVGPDGPGPLLRADLDALPFVEQTGLGHAARDGRHHACGHDGHMAMLAGAMAALVGSPPGPVYAFFQPAEETGAGAALALRDERLRRPFTRCFALHNVPGLPLGSVHVRPGVAAPASVGLAVRFVGATSHAAEPERGRSPVRALGDLVRTVEALPGVCRTPSLATVVGITAGGARYGTAPGDGELHATLRAHADADLARMLAVAEAEARALGERDGLFVKTERVEAFPACNNDPAAVALVQSAARAAGLAYSEPDAPTGWSEDFGHFLDRWPGALVLLGAGETQPELHSPRYDFPDALLDPGVRLWTRLAAAASG